MHVSLPIAERQTAAMLALWVCPAANPLSVIPAVMQMESKSMRHTCICRQEFDSMVPSNVWWDRDWETGLGWMLFCGDS